MSNTQVHVQTCKVMSIPDAILKHFSRCLRTSYNEQQNIYTCTCKIVQVLVFYFIMYFFQNSTISKKSMEPLVCVYLIHFSKLFSYLMQTLFSCLRVHRKLTELIGAFSKPKILAFCSLYNGLTRWKKLD